MRKQRFIGLLMGVLCLFETAKTQDNSDYLFYDNSVHLDTILEGRFDPDGPGFAFKILKDSKVIGKGKFGKANMDTDERIDFDTPFYIASIGKTFTSAAILILHQQRKLQLSDKLGKYFPGLPDYKNKISIEQLLNHSSGLPDHFEEFGEELDHLDNKMVIDFLKRSKPLFEPGTDYAYSNSAYVLLAEIVQQISGMSFSGFLSKYIFKPLQMTNTRVIERASDMPTHRARGYSQEGGGYVLNDYENIYTLGAGGIYSTIDDLVKWDQALYTERILSKRSKELAFTKAKIPNVRTYLAMGWMDESFGPKTVDFTGLSYVMSFGSLKGFRGRLMRFTDFNLSIIALSNSGDAHIWGEDFAKAFFKRK